MRDSPGPKRNSSRFCHPPDPEVRRRSDLKEDRRHPRIDNQIEVLPISPTDDQIRIAVYRAIFRYDGPLFRYATQVNAPIHIIVNNGRVTLKGNIDSAADSQVAYTAAKGISGVFDVKNELKVRG
jgi:hyperosmotically inducible protein